jgi:hypothetical protein
VEQAVDLDEQLMDPVSDRIKHTYLADNPGTELPESHITRVAIAFSPF